MPPIEEGIRERIAELLKRDYLNLIKVQIGSEINKMDRIVKEVKSFSRLNHSELDEHSNLANYKSQLRSLIEDVWQSPEGKNFSELYDSINISFDEAFKTVPYSKKKIQSKARFYAQPEDGSKVKILKFGKLALFGISRLPKYLAGTIRNKEYQVQYWKQKILVRNLAKYHFQSNLILDLKELTNIFFAALCETYLVIKTWEEELVSGDSIDSLSVEKKVKGLKNSIMRKLNNSLNLILERRMSEFSADLEKAGTVELPIGKLSDKTIQENIKESENRWAINNREWKNAIYALFEEWRSDLEIYTLKHRTIAAFENFQSAQIRKLVEQINPEVEFIVKHIQESEELLQKCPSERFIETLNKVSNLSNKKLDKEFLPKLTDKLTSQNIANVISKLELEIQQQVEGLANEHVIVKTGSYDHPIKTDELKKISPYELIAFEALVLFQQEIEAVKKGIFTSLENTTVEISDIGSIISFSVNSAISAYQEDGKSHEESTLIAVEGLQRAGNRLIKKQSELEESMKSNLEKLEQLIVAFCDRLMELTVNENVGELRLRIAKAKAAKQAEEIKEEVKERIRKRKRFLITFFTSLYRKGKVYLSSISQRFVLTAGKPVISRQISDFLLESQLAINTLPLIYKRLYRIEPLEDLELFEGRQEELRQLDEAFRNWNQGRYASTAILGEKWGGLTSFLNYALHRSNFPYPITRFAPKQNIFDEEGLIQLMKEIFQNDTFENLDQVVEYLNEGNKRIIVLEDLQNLYLRKIGGFTALQLLFQLITRTYSNVFWITSTTIYTWQYLVKAINIDEFFSYPIRMGDMTGEQIVNIVWKRNRISGYNILFEENRSHLDDKKFQKLDKKEKQEILKDEYFGSLNEFAKSNISLALIFWLLSTRKIDEHTITIGSFNKPDLNFISVLSMDKVYTLHALILHDGLAEWQLKDVLHTTESNARLNLLALLEDGIITKKESIYLVNPIVYRSIISMLKAKNLIH